MLVFREWIGFSNPRLNLELEVRGVFFLLLLGVLFGAISARFSGNFCLGPMIVSRSY